MAETKEQTIRLLTAGDIALRLGEREGRVRHALAAHDIRPAAVAGRVRIYDMAAVAAVAEALGVKAVANG